MDSHQNKIYVIIGDGECNEGSIWESALAAPNLGLDNLFVILDKNNLQQTGSTDDIMKTDNLKEKWLSFSKSGRLFNTNFWCNFRIYFPKRISDT